MDIIHPDIQSYLNILNKEDEELNKVKYSGTDEEIPIVDTEVGKLLYLLILTKQSKDILELGFGGGYSTLWMAKALANDGLITSLELNYQRIDRGKAIFKELNYKNKLNLLFTDVQSYLEECPYTYDLIFLDAIKRSYLNYLPHIPKLLNKNGIFIADNILFRGYVVQKELERKYIAGTEVIREFNTTLSRMPDFDTVFLPVGDGISLSVKK